LLCTRSKPAANTKLTEWAKKHYLTLGKRYSSELARRKNRTKSYKENTINTIQKEYEYAEKGDKSYTQLKPIWAILIVVSVALYFILSKDYFKGLAMGLMLLFLTTLILDSIMHNRLKTYLKGITEIRLE